MPRIAIQDGPDFYLFDRADDEDPADVIHAPFAFKDGDVASAEAARRWFLQRHPDVSFQSEGL